MHGIENFTVKVSINQISFTGCRINGRHNSQLFQRKFLTSCPNFRPPSAVQSLVFEHSACLSVFTGRQQTVLWLRRSDAGLSPRRPGFDRNSVYVEFVVGKVELEQAYLPLLRYSPSVSFHHRSIFFQCYQLTHARTDYRPLVDTPAGFHFPHIHARLRI